MDTRPRNAVVSCFNRHEKHLVIPQIEALDVHTTCVHGPCSRAVETGVIFEGEWNLQD